MLKLLTTFAVILISLVAFAEPKVGDYAKLSGTFIDEETKQQVPYWYSEEIVSFNVLTDKFTVRTFEFFKGETETWESELSANELEADHSVSRCPKKNGTLEVITVAAGEFQSCRILFNPHVNALYWYADVPFGQLKSDFPGRHHTELTEYRFGK